MTKLELHEALAAIGFNVQGIDHAGNMIANEPIVAGLVAAIEAVVDNPGNATAFLALEALLTDTQRHAYATRSNDAIAQQRRDRYRAEADSLGLKAMENAVVTVTNDGENYGIQVKKQDWDAWLAVKQRIRDELPYWLA
jgi:hypothetical protein